MPATPPASRHERIVEVLLARAAARAELMLAWGRSALAALLMLRFFAVGALAERGGLTRCLVGVSVSLVAISASLWIGRRARRGAVSAPLVYFSVVLDATLGTSALASNVISPWESYQGILRLPDVSAVLLLPLVGGLRGWPSTAALGGLLSLASVALLVALDQALNGARLTYHAKDVSMLVILVAATAVGASFIAARTRRLALAAAEKSLHAERTRAGLAAVLSDHHDARSVLTAATMNAERLLHSLERRAPGSKGDDDAGTDIDLARDLNEDLVELVSLVGAVRERAYSELAAADGMTLARASDVVRLVVATHQRRFPALSIQLACAVDRDAAVRVSGGAKGLERLLANLLTNACEGDGRQRASLIQVTVEPATGAPGRVAVTIADDGPGLDTTTGVVARGSDPASSKAGGAGLGIDLCRRLVTASGGELHLRNRPGGGLEVVVILHAPARSESPSHRA